MLKEVIVKRTFEIEKRLMGDVETLKKQVLALEMEKKTLEMDAKRLQLTLKEISSKCEKVCYNHNIRSSFFLLLFPNGTTNSCNRIRISCVSRSVKMKIFP